ncbi:hypothetical protein KIPB_006784, partial [Kipferlia bialata]|eukprot:g4686.t1
MCAQDPGHPSLLSVQYDAPLSSLSLSLAQRERVDTVILPSIYPGVEGEREVVGYVVKGSVLSYSYSLSPTSYPVGLTVPLTVTVTEEGEGEGVQSTEALTLTLNGSAYTLGWSEDTSSYSAQVVVRDACTASVTGAVSGTVLLQETLTTYTPFTHITQLSRDDGASDDYYAGYTAVYGDWAMISAFGRGTGNTGACYVYHSVDGVWEYTQTLESETPSSNNSFGADLAMGDGWAAIGSYYAGNGVGFVDMYSLDTETGTWAKTERLASDTGRVFGTSIAISGTSLAIGAGYEDDGAVYVYTLEEGVGGTLSWELQQRLKPAVYIDDSVSFGVAVALDGDRLAVGTWDSPGLVYIFDRVGTTWTQTYLIESNWHFGRTVALSGDTLVVWQEDRYVFVYTKVGDDWVAQQTLIGVTNGSHFGRALSLVGSTLVVGASAENSGTGAVYVYQEQDGVWEVVYQMDGTASGASLGYSVSLSGSTLVVGARGWDGNIGAALILDSVYEPSAPQELLIGTTAVKVSMSDLEEPGMAVSLSLDSTTYSLDWQGETGTYYLDSSTVLVDDTSVEASIHYTPVPECSLIEYVSVPVSLEYGPVVDVYCPPVDVSETTLSVYLYNSLGASIIEAEREVLVQYDDSGVDIQGVWDTDAGVISTALPAAGLHALHVYVDGDVFSVPASVYDAASLPTGASADVSPLYLPVSIPTTVSITVLDAEGGVVGGDTPSVSITVGGVVIPAGWDQDTYTHTASVTLSQTGTAEVKVGDSVVQEVGLYVDVASFTVDNTFIGGSDIPVGFHIYDHDDIHRLDSSRAGAFELWLNSKGQSSAVTSTYDTDTASDPPCPEYRVLLDVSTLSAGIHDVSLLTDSGNILSSTVTVAGTPDGVSVSGSLVTTVVAGVDASLTLTVTGDGVPIHTPLSLSVLVEGEADTPDACVFNRSDAFSYTCPVGATTAGSTSYTITASYGSESETVYTSALTVSIAPYSFDYTSQFYQTDQAGVATVHPQWTYGIPVYESFGCEMRAFDAFGNEFSSAPSGVTVSVEYGGSEGSQTVNADWDTDSQAFSTAALLSEATPGVYSVTFSVTQGGTTDTLQLSTEIVHAAPSTTLTSIDIAEGVLAGTSRTLTVTPVDGYGHAVTDMRVQASWHSKDISASAVSPSGAVSLDYDITVPTQVGATPLYVWLSYPDGTGTVDIQRSVDVSAGDTSSFTIALKELSPYGCGVTTCAVVLSLFDAYSNAVGNDGRVTSVYRSDCPSCDNTVTYANNTFQDSSLALPDYDCDAGTADIPVTLVTEQGTELSATLTVPGSPDIAHTVVETAHIEATAGVSVLQKVILYDSDGTYAGSDHQVSSRVSLDGVDTSSACTVTDSGAFACES